MYCRLSTQSYMLLSIIFFHSMAQVECVSFNMDLIHRDSPHSPLYNESMSQIELLTKDVQRSYARVNIVNSSFNYRNEIGMESTLEGYGETYLAHYNLGSDKKFQVRAFVSITRNFGLIKCEGPNQDEVAYVEKAKSYKTIGPDDFQCRYIKEFRLENSPESCQYNYKVDEEVYSKGELGEDVFFFPTSRADPDNMEWTRRYFGCSFENRGFDKEVQGVLALGQGVTSFVGQYRNAVGLSEALQDRLVIYVFSYCLRSIEDGGISSLKFRSNERSRYSMYHQCPLIKPRNGGGIYYLQLNSVSMGDSDTPIRTTNDNNLMAIDIGTPMTFLVYPVYEQVEAKIRKTVVKIDEEPLAKFKLCFEDNPKNQELVSDIVLHFHGASFKLGVKHFHGASFKLGVNAFVKIDNKLCMAILPTHGQHSILGSLAQVNHVMEFDLWMNCVAFTEILTGCGQF